MKRKIIDETENLLVNNSTGSSSVMTLEDDIVYPLQETNGFSPKEFSDVENKNNLNGVILEQDRFLPIANINRIMKNVIPREGKLSKEAKECVQECVTEFLLFITSEASERCATEKRKTITGEDLLLAFQTLGFDDYVEPLQEFLQKYREANKMQQTSRDESIENLSISSAQPPQCYSINSNENQMRLTQLQETTQYNMTPTTSTSTSNDFSSNKEIDANQKIQQVIMPNTLQPMQMYFDPVAAQHYVAVQAADGTQTLLPVNLTPATQTQQPQAQTKSIVENPTNISTLPITSSRRNRNSNTFNNILNGEQSVRHYLQSQELKRKAANKS